MALQFLHNLFRSAGLRLAAIMALVAVLVCVSAAFCRDDPKSGPPAAVMVEKLWNRAAELQSSGDGEGAANTYLRLFQDYPTAPQAEDALWQAILYYRETARSDRKYVDSLQDLYRRFTASFPDSPRAEDMYLETGLLYYGKGYYREALARFRLLEKKFQGTPLAARAEYLAAMASINLGQLNEARSLFERYAAGHDTELKAKGLAGLGGILFREGKNEKALESIKKSLSLSSSFYLNYPEAEVLRDFGEIYFRIGNEEYGRKNLLHYLNIVGNSDDRQEILLQIAESFRRQGMSRAAQGVYETIVEDGDDTRKPYIVARFRIAEFLDDPANVLSKWQLHGDLQDPSGDLPFTSLLASFKQGPPAQDARRALFRRYEARNDFDGALNMARLYLRELPAEEEKPVLRKTADDMLIYVVEHLMKEKKYEETYDFYKMQHRHVQQYPEGRLLYLVGQALEGLFLYDQAAAIYWRALALPLSDADKTDLYFRRARVYLAMKDFDSANRLLTYLRDVYAKTKAIGEIYYLSGRLAEDKKDADGALAYYRQAYEAPSDSPDRPQYVEAYLRLLLEKKQLADMEKILLPADGKLEDLEAADRQAWLLRFADAIVQKDSRDAAEKIYREALSTSLPQQSREAQKARLQLGDILSGRGKKADGASLYKEAAKGPDGLLQTVATERLKQMEIEKTISTLDLPK